MSKMESNDRTVLHHTHYERFRTQNTTLLNFTNCKSSSSAVNKFAQIDFDKCVMKHQITRTTQYYATQPKTLKLLNNKR